MEDESNNSEMETAELTAFEAIELLNSQDDMSEDSTVEQTEDNVEVEAASEIDVDTPEDVEQFFEINGEQIALSELRSGYLRQSDYTRKTQEIAEQRKAYQEAQFDRQQLRTEALQGIEALKQQMMVEFSQMQTPDWDYLVENDPAEFQRQQYLWNKREAAVRQMYDVEMNMRAKAEAYEKEQHQFAIQESQKQFLQKYPEMRDQAKSSEVLGEITGLLIDNGFSREEIQGVSDWRIVGLLYELNKAVKAQKGVSPMIQQKLEQKPPISQKQPGKSEIAGPANKAKAQFNKTLSKNDALAYLDSL